MSPLQTSITRGPVAYNMGMPDDLTAKPASSRKRW